MIDWLIIYQSSQKLAELKSSRANWAKFSSRAKI